jgi:hypothetical protein
MTIQVTESAADYTGLIAEADYQEFIRYNGTDQSTIMPQLVESAIRQAEAYCNTTFGNKTFVVYFENAESGCVYSLPHGPIQDVTEVAKLTKSDGAVPDEDAITTGFYLGPNKDSISFNIFGSYKVTYTAGIATPANVNKQVKEAILHILSENFDNRDEVVLGESVAKLPRNSKVLLAPFRKRIL